MNFKLTILLLCSLAILGCRKAERDFDDSLLASADEVAAHMYLSNTFLIIDEVAKKEYGMIPSYTSGNLNCASVVVNTLGTPNTFSINFGTGCIGSDGRTRKGTLYTTVLGTYGDSLTVTTLDFVDFFIDDLELDGSVTFTDNGIDSAGYKNLIYSFSDVLLKQFSPDITATLNGEGRYTLTDEGVPTDIMDDIYAISGSSNSTSRSGNNYEATITSPLIYDHSCDFISEGLMELIPSNINTRFIDFGDGTCDSNVIVTISETKHLIILE